MRVMKKIYLRNMEMSDAKDLLEIFSNPISTKYWLSSCHTIEEVKFMMKVEYLSYRQRGLTCPSVLVLDDKVIGVCNYNDEFDGVGRIGFILNHDFEGKGYMSMALKELIHEGFHIIGYHRIEALVFCENMKSKKILESLGFMKEGTMRSYLKHQNKLHDIDLYAIVKSLGNMSIK